MDAGRGDGRAAKSAYVEVRMTPELRARIEDAAGPEGVTKSEWVRAACEDRLRREGR